MSIVSLDQVKAMLRSVIGITDRSIAKAQEDATKAQEIANAAQGNVAGKMDANNPVGTGSFSMGRLAYSTVGTDSHAEGGDTTASGDYSHAEGRGTKATGWISHAEGEYTVASGASSHAEGKQTQASGTFSHAEGGGTTASGDYSHAEGYKTTAASKCQHVQGVYNIEDSENKYAHIVGNGNYDNNVPELSNAHTLDWDGNAWYAGYVEGTSLILPSPNGTRWKITVNDDGSLSTAKVDE